PRIGELLQDRDPEADMDRMIKEFDQAQLARNLLESSRIGQITLAKNLDKFLQSEALDHGELARIIMDNGREDILAHHLDKFQDGAVDHARLAQDLMNRGSIGAEILAKNLDKFPYGAVDHALLASRMMDTGLERVLVRNLDKFQEPPADVRDRLPT
ncbi:hypothetical protein BRC21_00090, partial [Candidatus Saccharibacteria bacterium SW_7_54_9]